jgi:hypothetical protein
MTINPNAKILSVMVYQYCIPMPKLPPNNAVCLDFTTPTPTQPRWVSPPPKNYTLFDKPTSSNIFHYFPITVPLSLLWEIYPL